VFFFHVRLLDRIDFILIDIFYLSHYINV
jgi:hypothetical protein